MKKNDNKQSGGNINLSFGLGDLFTGIGNLVEMATKLKEEFPEGVSRQGEIEGLGDKLKGVYGFTIKSGLGGTPTVESFGNIRKTPAGPVVEPVREPVVDVFDEDDRITIIAELPGIEEEEIGTEIRGDILIINAGKGEKTFAKEIILPFPCEGRELKKSYKNGILEITVAK